MHEDYIETEIVITVRHTVDNSLQLQQAGVLAATLLQLDGDRAVDDLEPVLTADNPDEAAVRSVIAQRLRALAHAGGWWPEVPGTSSKIKRIYLSGDE